MSEGITYVLEAYCFLSSKWLTMGSHFRSFETSNLYLPLLFVIYTSLIPTYKTYFYGCTEFGKNKSIFLIFKLIFGT